MLRLSPVPDTYVLEQALEFKGEPGGSEANVAITLARLGHRTMMLTALPDNPLGQKTRRYLSWHDVDAGRVLMLDRGRMGLYFTEKGSGARPSRVFYDRRDSSYNFLDEAVADLNAWLSGCSWLHLSGIALATSPRAADFALAVSEVANNLGIPISLDINHRKQLWGWCDNEARRRAYLQKVIERTKVLVGNETDLQIGWLGKPELTEDDLVARLGDVAGKGDLQWVAISQRESKRADENGFGGVIYDFRDNASHPVKHQAAPRIITHMVDRVGAGDAFCGVILDGFIRNLSPARTLERAVMMGALMHGVAGDACMINEDFLERCLSDTSGRIVR
jgi:2-dehydro-3-deoxygluconokinase